MVENLLDGSVKFTAPTMVKKTELFKDVVSSFPPTYKPYFKIPMFYEFYQERLTNKKTFIKKYNNLSISKKISFKAYACRLDFARDGLSKRAKYKTLESMFEDFNKHIFSEIAKVPMESVEFKKTFPNIDPVLIKRG